ncbi:hypothetical protein V5F44_06660 [Xanthobacter sp. V2C-8]|uniref:hypothetical protein n=1 Tax=Xanthobacter albus TaxID=3119929 RepID=UPI003728DD21
MDDAADDPTVIDPRHAMGSGQEWRDPRHLPRAHQEHITHAGLLHGDGESLLIPD